MMAEVEVEMAMEMMALILLVELPSSSARQQLNPFLQVGYNAMQERVHYALLGSAH